ncbi:MAG: polysaccharide deacetylase [bacterium]|nr:polysaccharide deacetylase [bacterium]
MASRGGYSNSGRGQYVKRKPTSGSSRGYSRSSYGGGGRGSRNSYQRSSYSSKPPSKGRGSSGRRGGGSAIPKIILILIILGLLVAGFFFVRGKIQGIREVNQMIDKADEMAVQYDYRGAIEMLQQIPEYETKSKVTDKIAELEQLDAACYTVDNSTVTHVFYHSLVMYPDWTFHIDDQTEVDNYNTTMTTGDEFIKITQQMYDRGYVLISIHDMYEITTDENGKEVCKSKEIRLPQGKKPYVLSIDDLSYYEYMEGDGFPTRIVLDEDGVPRCEMTMQDGTVEIGSFDHVPLLEDFIAEHPDACYKGARGIIALTGYDGVLGYRTDEEYNTAEYKAEHPSFDFEKECADAKAVADGMKARGWEFASHSWGHQNYTTISMAKMKTDMGKWLKNVVPIIGETDVIIYAFGAEIPEYGKGNDKFDYLKSCGFDCFCGINAATTSWVYYGDNYFRQSRRNLDGYRMYQDLINPDLNRLADLMNVEETFDKRRPTPVPDY